MTLNWGPFLLPCTCILLVSAAAYQKRSETLTFIPSDWVTVKYRYPYHTFSQLLLLPEWHSSGLFTHSLRQGHPSFLFLPHFILSTVSKRHPRTCYTTAPCTNPFRASVSYPLPFRIFKNHDVALNQHFHTTPFSPTSFVVQYFAGRWFQAATKPHPALKTSHFSRAQGKPQDFTACCISHTKIPFRTPLKDGVRRFSVAVGSSGLGWDWDNSSCCCLALGVREGWFQGWAEPGIRREAAGSLPARLVLSILQGVLPWHRRLSPALFILMRDNCPKNWQEKITVPGPWAAGNGLK